MTPRQAPGAWPHAVVTWWLRLPVGLRAAAPLAVAGVLWVLSSQPAGPAAPGVLQQWLHNGAHVVAYAVLGLAVWLAGARVALPDHGGWRGLSALLATGYGAMDEWHQSWVPGRVASAADLLSDGCGAAIGVLIGRLLWRAEPRVLRSLGLMLLASLASVSLATWGRW